MKPDFSEAVLEEIVVHRVGSHAEDEGVQLTDSPLGELDADSLSLLRHYFLKSFKSEEFFGFHHESDLTLNETYNYVDEVFEDPDKLYLQSVKIAKHLYEESTHPNIKPGELYVAYFSYVLLGEERVDAVGIFKSESRQSYLKVFLKDGEADVDSDQGIDINKLDKGCIIFNSRKDMGYRVLVVDQTNKGQEAHYWKEDFLRVKPFQDNFLHTKNVMNLAKTFIEKELDKEYEVDKVDKIDLMNRSSKYMERNDTFRIDTFQEEVFQEPEFIDSFQQYKQKFNEEEEVGTFDEFEISKSAYKGNKKFFKSVVKLDKNFHIYIHGNRELVEKGFDPEKGKNFYLLYYDNES